MPLLLPPLPLQQLLPPQPRPPTHFPLPLPPLFRQLQFPTPITITAATTNSKTCTKRPPLRQPTLLTPQRRPPQPPPPPEQPPWPLPNSLTDPGDLRKWPHAKKSPNPKLGYAICTFCKSLIMISKKVRCDTNNGNVSELMTF